MWHPPTAPMVHHQLLGLLGLLQQGRSSMHDACVHAYMEAQWRCWCSTRQYNLLNGCDGARQHPVNVSTSVRGVATSGNPNILSRSSHQPPPQCWRGVVYALPTHNLPLLLCFALLSGSGGLHIAVTRYELLWNQCKVLFCLLKVKPHRFTKPFALRA